MTLTPAPLERRIADAMRRATFDPRGVIASMRVLLDEAPRHVALRFALVRALLQTSDVDAALAIAGDDALIDDTAALAAVLGDFARHDAPAAQAVLLLLRAERHPNDFNAALALASTLHGLARASEALEWSERAHALRPHESLPLEIAATARIDRGDVEAGLEGYASLLATSGDAALAARHLVLMHYDPAQTNAELFAALDAYAKRRLRAVAPPIARRGASAGRRLRVGWLSPRFVEGPVARFLTALLEAFDRTRFRHALIALQPGGDAATRRFVALADEWIDLSGLDDATLLARLRALELDVLVDLAGHSTANRLDVIAQRAAPVQVSWLDWFDTTAAPNVDVWLGDPWLTPIASTQRYTERIVRLASGRFCYTPPDDAPDARHRGGDRPVAFASFNRLAKLGADVVATWSDILRRVPEATLALGARALEEPATREHTFARFAAHGIGADRLRLHGHRDYGALLDAYTDIDIALDPFPFSGCTTTCDALYMGAAVVTWPGETFVSRQSAGLLARIGRDAWIAGDAGDYVERAVAMARDVGALRSGREVLRRDVVVGLCDARAQAAEFAAVFERLVAETERA
jgi:protein O-GlcNAc transferase